MQKKVILDMLKKGGSFNRFSDSELLEFYDDTIESMDGMHTHDHIGLTGFGHVAVIQYWGSFPHCRIRWMSKNDGHLSHNETFDTLFEGIESLVSRLDDDDAGILWQWYIDNGSEQK